MPKSGLTGDDLKKRFFNLHIPFRLKGYTGFMISKARFSYFLIIFYSDRNLEI